MKRRERSAIHEAWKRMPHPHVSLSKVTVGVHAVYYFTEAAGVHFLHYGTVWGVLILLCVSLVVGDAGDPGH